MVRVQANRQRVITATVSLTQEQIEEIVVDWLRKHHNDFSDIQPESFKLERMDAGTPNDPVLCLRATRQDGGVDTGVRPPNNHVRLVHPRPTPVA